jgi:hypothetical protein
VNRPLPLGYDADRCGAEADDDSPGRRRDQGRSEEVFPDFAVWPGSASTPTTESARVPYRCQSDLPDKRVQRFLAIQEDKLQSRRTEADRVFGVPLWSATLATAVGDSRFRVF